MFLVFDCFSGLCNQFYDIQCAVNFCLHYKIPFTFRNACFRGMNLEKFETTAFENLFDIEYFKQFDLYIPFSCTSFSDEDIYNVKGAVLCKDIFIKESPGCEEIYETLKQIKKPCIVLKQFWYTYRFEHQYILVYPHLKPCQHLLNIFHQIKSEIIEEGQEYNFLHYRHEVDFLNHFKITNLEDINELLKKALFQNNELKTFVATTNLKNLIYDKTLYEKIIFKKEEHDLIIPLNFEERAFIDYLFGLESKEVYGHSNSSFSHMLNNSKQTSNYYNQ